MSPSARSSFSGTSFIVTNLLASNRPGLPGWMLGLAAVCCSTGNQPISSSAPVHTDRSALRKCAIRLGRGWIWCGSCWPVVATYRSTSLPPISLTRAPHSGSQAKTFSAAEAGAAAAIRTAQAARRSRIFIGAGSEGVGRVRTQAEDVLQEHLVVAGAGDARFVAVVLQPQAAELAVRPVDHRAVALRMALVGEDRQGGAVRRVGDVV